VCGDRTAGEVLVLSGVIFQRDLPEDARSVSGMCYREIKHLRDK